VAKTSKRQSKKASAEFSQEDDDLLSELGIDVEAEVPTGKSAREERILAGFEDIQRFVEQHQRVPEHAEHRDIFERLYAVRLEQIRKSPECRSIVAAHDHQRLLDGADTNDPTDTSKLSDEELLAALGVDADEQSVTELRHVRSQADIRATPEDIAKQQPCADFKRYAPLFERAEQELKSGERHARPFGQDASIRVGDFFILSGQMVYVAGIGEYFKAPNGEQDARLKAIYSNGTESNLLLRSLQRALYKDEAGRRLTEPGAGPLFADQIEPDDIESGYIYVLRSQSTHPYIAAHRELIHKIGVTGRSIESRIQNAANTSTFLFAEVEVIASYQLAGVNRVKLENLIHRIFAPAQLDLVLHDPFGAPLKPREWFLVPLSAIDEAVRRIKDGSITNRVYAPQFAQLVEG
jgi:hypothetical protein